ncbi:MAG: hypothetical protein EDM05_58320 [Leptolyngbya sp. IPPAS B-1204]
MTSLIYMDDLQKSFQTYPQDNTAEYFPPIRGKTFTRRLAQMPTIVVPLLFSITSAVLLIQEIC